MDLLKKMSAFVDKQLAEVEEQERLDADWQSRRNKPIEKNEGAT